MDVGRADAEEYERLVGGVKWSIGAIKRERGTRGRVGGSGQLISAPSAHAVCQRLFQAVFHGSRRSAMPRRPELWQEAISPPVFHEVFRINRSNALEPTRTDCDQVEHCGEVIVR